MILDEGRFKQEVDKLQEQIRSVKYMLRMDRVSPHDVDNSMVSSLYDLEQKMFDLLNLVRAARENERKKLSTISPPEEIPLDTPR